MKINKKAYELALAKAEMNTRHLANVCKVSESTLSKAVNGITEPRPATLGRMARALKVPVEEIILREEE